MDTSLPVDLPLIVFCRSRFINSDHSKAYVAGAISGIKYAFYLIKKGLTYSSFEIWSPLHGLINPDLDELLYKINLYLDDKYKLADLDFLCQPELSVSYKYFESFREYGPEVFKLYRFLDGYISRSEILQVLTEVIGEYLNKMVTVLETLD